MGQVVAIIGGKIIDGNGGIPIEEGVILIEGKRIFAVGDRSIPIPPDAKRIRAIGKFVIPGLMDPNQFLVSAAWPPGAFRCEGRYDEVAIEAAQLALKGGITTVFELLGPRDPVIKARNAINEGRAIGARISVSGHWVGCGGPFSPDLYDHGNEDVGAHSAERNMEAVRSAMDPAFKARINSLWTVNIGEQLLRMPLDAVRQEIRNYVQSGVDIVTYLVNSHRLGAYQYIAFSSRVQRMIVEEAHHAGLPVRAMFASTEEGIHSALDAGADILFPAPGFGGRPMSTETATRIAQSGVFVQHEVAPTGDLAWYRQQPPNALYPGLVESMEISELSLRGLIRAGASLLQGGGSGMFSEEQLKAFSPGLAPGSFSPLGEGHVRGLQALQEKGMTPMDALITATRNIARAFKVDKDLGTLEPRKVADLVILDKSPLEDSRNYLGIHLVMKDGQIIDRGALPTQRVWTAPSPAQTATSN